MASGSSKANVSHDEIWDDSVLIDSWNEALAEYKKYHSIHLKGGNVQDLLAEAEKEKAAEDGADVEQPVEDGTLSTPPSGNTGTHPQEQDADKHGPATVPGEAPMPPPQAILGSVRDEGLKKLLMSWYYAGYYTGLYEGQQQAQQQQQQQ